MFEDALLDSSPQQISVLRRIHFLVSALAGALFFVQGLYLLPLVFAPTGFRTLITGAAIVGAVAALYALMLCYVWADAQQQRLRAWPWVGVTLLLNLPGFLIYLVYSAQRSGDWKRAAIPLAYVAESMLVGVLILIPLIYTQALPRQLVMTWPNIASSPGPPPARPTGEHPMPPAHHATVDPFTAPPRIPPTVAVIIEASQPPEAAESAGVYIPGTLPGNGSGPGLVPGGAPWNTGTPPPARVVHAAPKPQLYRQGGDVTAAHAVFQPRPVYPRLAIMAHVQGTVVLQAILGKDGTVQDLKVISGPALLVSSALDAVRTWRYQPTLLNSEPVDVITEIDVNFKLGE
jgi:protein TonB